MESAGRIMPACWNHAAAVQRLGGDESLLQELISIFFEDYPRLAARLERGLEQADFAALREAAHSLKGSLAYLGAPEIAACALELEKAARQEDLSAAAERTQRLMVAVEELRKAMCAIVGDR